MPPVGGEGHGVDLKRKPKTLNATASGPGLFVGVGVEVQVKGILFRSVGSIQDSVYNVGFRV